MVLILAYGNSLRRDDRAGFVLADVVERMLCETGFEVERIDSHQLDPELALDIASEKVKSVLFIDTRIVPEIQNETETPFPLPASLSPVPAPVSDCLCVRFTRVSCPENTSPGMGHQLNASTLLAYSRYLFNKEPPAWLITVPGIDFDHGEGLSETARDAVNSSPEILRELIGLLT